MPADLFVLVMIAVIAEFITVLGLLTHIGSFYVAGGMVQGLNVAITLGSGSVVYSSVTIAPPSLDFEGIALTLAVLAIVNFLFIFYEKYR